MELWRLRDVLNEYPDNIIMSSYEGTGRSLSLKLIQQLREQGQNAPADGGVTSGKYFGCSLIIFLAAVMRSLMPHCVLLCRLVGRVFKEVELAEPIRYAAGDKIEAWLHDLLCLDASNHIPNIEGR